MWREAVERDSSFCRWLFGFLHLAKCLFCWSCGITQGSRMEWDGERCGSASEWDLCFVWGHEQSKCARRRAERTEQGARRPAGAHAAHRRRDTQGWRKDGSLALGHTEAVVKSSGSCGAGGDIMVVSARSWVANEGGKHLVLVGKRLLSKEILELL